MASPYLAAGRRLRDTRVIWCWRKTDVQLLITDLGPLPVGMHKQH